MTDDRDTYARIHVRVNVRFSPRNDALGVRRSYPGKSRTVRESDGAVMNIYSEIGRVAVRSATFIANARTREPQLAEAVEALAEQLAEMTAARDAACALARLAGPHMIDRIAELRKVGAK